MKKKFKRADLIRSIITSTCLLGASTGIIFGVSAGNFSIDYIDLNNAYTRLDAALNPATNYSSQNIKSQWNFSAKDYPGSVDLEPHSPNFPADDEAAAEQYFKLHPDDNDRKYVQYNRDDKNQLMTGEHEYLTHRLRYCAMVLDGASHSELDRSFNQSVLQGLADFCKDQKNAPLDSDIRGIAFKPGQDSTQFFHDIYREVVGTGRRVLALPGFVHVTPLESLGSRDETEDTGIVHYNGERNVDGTVFVLIDGNVPNNQNVASVLFRSDQPAFLSAISTAMYFLNNLNIYHNNYQDLSVGVYGGTPIPTVVIYMGGFQRGIEFFNEFILKQILADLRACLDETKQIDDYPYAKKIMESSKYKESDLDKWSTLEDTRKDELIDVELGTGLLYDEFSIKLIKLGDFNTLFTGSFAAGDAIGITKQLLNRGASAILPVAGSQTVDSTQEVASQKSNCTILGVDSAMEDGDAQRALPSQFKDQTKAPDGSESDHSGDLIKFSAVKDMTTVVNKICELCMNNIFWDSSTPDGTKPDPEKAICNAGYQTCGNIRNGLISVSFDGFYFLMEGLKQIVNAKKLVDGGLKSIKFVDLWIEQVDAYCDEHSEEFESPDEKEDFVRNATSFGVPPAGEEDDTGILTFNKGTTDKPTMIYKYYSQVMSILGETLNEMYMTFNKDMSLLLPPNPDYDDPEHPWQPALAGDAQDGTILEWLKYNMYFTC